MLPFIVALIFAVGLPLMPSSLHRALHLPTLKFNFLSARHEPEQLFVSSPEPTLLLERSYSEASPDSGGSQYLVFPDISSQDYRDDTAAAPAGMSLTEKQEYPQTSIWNTIHAQLLYQLAETTIVITLSFFAAAAFFPRHYLYTLLERLCTALFIYRQYSPKAALSSFLQDVFSGLHRYWMENSVVKGQAPKSDADTSWLATLEVFADVAPGGYCERGASVSSASVSVRQDHLNIVPLDKANLCFGRSSFIASSISLVQSAKIFPPIDAACTPLLDVSSHGEIEISEQDRREPQCILGTIIKRDPSYTTPPTVITETMKCDLDTSDAETVSHSGISPLHLLETPEPSINTSLPVSSHLHSSTGSPPSISMEDLYNSARRGIATALPSEPFRGIQEAIASDPSANSCSSCGHEPLRNIAGTTPNPESERFQSESDSTSSLRISQGNRRRYRSDGVQVRADSCYLGDTAAPLAPAKVDATCAFWKCALQNGGGNVETVVKEASESGTFPGSSAAPHIGGDNPELADGSPTVTDTALTGIVITPEGMLVVPASQRQDGSLRREIRVRPGHTLREPLAEKYRPPAARRRTSTWDPRMHECTESPSASPHPHDFLLPFTPKGMRQQLYVRHNNSPAALSDNWRRSSSSPTVEGTPSIAPLTLPSMEVKLSPAVVEVHERKSPSKTSPSLISTSSMIMMATQVIAPVSNLVSFPIQSAYPLSSRSAALGSSPTKNATETVKETTQASNSVSRDCCADRQPEEPSPTPCISTDAKGAGRLPLKDITRSMVPRPKAIDFQAHTLPITATGSTLAILKQATHSKETLKMPNPIGEGVTRATVPPNSPRKRKPSVEPNVPYAAEVLQLSDTPTPYHRPRARRSAPHLGKYTHNNKMQQVKVPRAAQTPDGSKRQRTRTASARGVENWNFNWATPTIDSNGQIVIPAGLGWKGRSSVGAGAMAGQPQPQRQGQPIQAIV